MDRHRSPEARRPAKAASYQAGTLRAHELVLYACVKAMGAGDTWREILILGLRRLSMSEDSDRSGEARQSGCQPTTGGSGVTGRGGRPREHLFSGSCIWSTPGALAHNPW